MIPKLGSHKPLPPQKMRVSKCRLEEQKIGARAIGAQTDWFGFNVYKCRVVGQNFQRSDFAKREQRDVITYI